MKIKSMKDQILSSKGRGSLTLEPHSLTPGADPGKNEKVGANLRLSWSCIISYEINNLSYVALCDYPSNPRTSPKSSSIVFLISSEEGLKVSSHGRGSLGIRRRRCGGALGVRSGGLVGGDLSQLNLGKIFGDMHN